MSDITPEFAEILGLLCAEGCYIERQNTYWGKDRGKERLFKNHKSIRIEFYNKDIKLVNRYQELLFKEFNYSTKITKFGKINVCRRDIISQIISKTKLGHLNWNVPRDISKGDKDIQIPFIRGYFDGDGTSIHNIRFFSTNLMGLVNVSKILINLNFNPAFPKPMIKENRKPLYVLQLSLKEKERFLKEINPVLKRSGPYAGVIIKPRFGNP